MGIVCCATKNGSICCGLFSIIGAFFLAIFLGLLTWQWEFIHGIHNHEEAEHAKTNSMVACIIYAVIFLMCVASFHYHVKKEKEAGASDKQTSSVLNDSNSALQKLLSEKDGHQQETTVTET
mmetsp:Transcript_12662/g.22555  ORF Transcript_12662/g.22555 Transcript_12662/m.22555 type:complete len:122 (+) Transcript_12662:352-717(+)|eukprot:CAMPEP_0184542614 /NCGR_PEP_ID=MMETSP0199_2-20130426/2239_1 /TAXON_ID=1112570 /ORGANISM="Thraustochytrium sp., Strain LLF1b" /LENGTH=121 /DNA_ID=CAMNT_0026936477 /DNA_START=371 /DNA_END=736 /DNA_ORIENTATION=+